MVWKTSIILTVLATATLTAAMPLERRAANSSSSFDVASIDITRLSGDPKANAEKICPAGIANAADNKAKGALAERIEKEFWNPEIANAIKAGLKAQKKALDCQRNRNKVLKNTCQFEDTSARGKDDQRDLNAKQVKNNVAGAAVKCEGADTSLFKTPTLSGDGKVETGDGKKDKKDKKEKKSKKNKDGSSKKKDKKDKSTVSTGSTNSTVSTDSTGSTNSTVSTDSTGSTDGTDDDPAV